jgi:hypothetical protein
MYTIYHIEGVKIGCSKNPKRRVKDQGYGAFQVLEVHTDIQIASKRETELQLEYGYGRDNKPYAQTVSMPTPASNSKGGKKGGQKNVVSGHLEIIGKIGNNKIRTCPWCFKTSKAGGYYRWHGDRCKFAW